MSLVELNETQRERRADMNTRPSQKRSESHRNLSEQVERPARLPLT